MKALVTINNWFTQHQLFFMGCGATEAAARVDAAVRIGQRNVGSDRAHPFKGGFVIECSDELAKLLAGKKTSAIQSAIHPDALFIDAYLRLASYSQAERESLPRTVKFANDQIALEMFRSADGVIARQETIAWWGDVEARRLKAIEASNVPAKKVA